MRRLVKGPPVEERLIVALDVFDVGIACSIAEKLIGAVHWVKLRPNLLYDDGFESELLPILHESNIAILADLQSCATESQLEQMIEIAESSGCSALSVKGTSKQMLCAREKVHRSGKALNIVTPVLATTLDVGDFSIESSIDVEKYITRKIAEASDLKLSGAITSCRELLSLPSPQRQSMIFIAPAIRDVTIAPPLTQDDQKRTCTVYQAIRNGADYLMVGRPIVQSDDPNIKARSIVAAIETAIHNFSD